MGRNQATASALTHTPNGNTHITRVFIHLLHCSVIRKFAVFDFYMQEANIINIQICLNHQPGPVIT